MVAIAPVIDIAKEAGKAALRELTPDLEVIIKDDGSPYTEADMAAHRIVSKGLRDLTPDIPVVSEEASTEANLAAMQSPQHWVVDPLDGSRTSIGYAKGKANHEGFGVHIALVENGEPKQGVIYFPAKDEGGTLYYTGNDGKAYRQIGEQPPRKIQPTALPIRNPLRAAVSWRKESREETILGRTVEHIPEVGGGRVCLAAEGTADIAHVERPFSHWDLAAAHAVLRAAGGELVHTDSGKTVTYDNADFSVAPCIAGSKDTLKFLGLGHGLPNAGRQVG